MKVPIKFDCLPPEVQFNASYEELTNCGWRCTGLVLAKIALPNGKQVHFHVIVGIDGRDGVYVKVGNQNNTRSVNFRPTEHKAK